MKIYLSIDNIPELAALPKKERKNIWRRYYIKGFRHWQTWAGYFICGLYSGLGVCFLVKALSIIQYDPRMFPILILPLLPAFPLGGIAASIHIEQVRPYLREFLEKID